MCIARSSGPLFSHKIRGHSLEVLFVSFKWLKSLLQLSRLLHLLHLLHQLLLYKFNKFNSPKAANLEVNIHCLLELLVSI